jgi:hypothetical protein
LDGRRVAEEYIGFIGVVQDLPTPFLKSAYSKSVHMPPVRIGMSKAESGRVVQGLPTPFLKSAYSKSVHMPPVRIRMSKPESGLVLNKLFRSGKS